MNGILGANFTLSDPSPQSLGVARLWAALSKPRAMRSFALLVATVGLLGLSSCRWKIKPTYPADKGVSALKKMCAHDYQMTVEARVMDNSLQVFFWRVGLLKNGQTEMRADAADSLERVLLCATRIALSTNAPLKFVEIKMVDVLTGGAVTLWRYVPDIRDSMYTRIAEDEYINRLVMQVDSDGLRETQDRVPHWSKPITMNEFIAKQIVLRVKRAAPAGLQAHEDLSHPSLLTVVIDNMPITTDKDTEDESVKVSGLFEKATRDVMKGYRYSGFQGLILKDNQGLPLGKWTL